MEEIKLNRTGQRPIAFIGTEIFNGSTKEYNSTRWERVRIFETDKGDYKVGIAKMTYFEEETNAYEVTTFKDKDKVISFVIKEVPDIDLENLTSALSKEENGINKRTANKSRKNA